MKRFKILSTAFLSVLILTGCQTEEDNHENHEHHSEANGYDEEVLERIQIKKIADKNAIFFNENLNHSITSSFEDFGETMEFTTKKEGNLHVTEGSYSSGLEFYRIYEITDTTIKLVYEVTSNAKKEYNNFIGTEKPLSKFINLDQILLEKPYNVGHSWVGGEISDIYSIRGDTFLEVTYDNKNVYLFKENKGLAQITYSLPPELLAVYGTLITEIKAK